MAKKNYKRRDKVRGEKSFHYKDLITVNPMTESQRDTFTAYQDGLNLLLSGCAGSGKTLISMYLGLMDVLDPRTDYDSLCVVRSIVPSREIGFLPGTKEEKEEVYEAPYRAICDELFPFSNSYNNMKKVGLIQFLSTSFIRGITLDNTVIVVDESQNFNMEELSTVMTRVGRECSIIFCGDTEQNDLYRKRNDSSGFGYFTEIVKRMPSFATIEYGINDIVRSGIVKEFLIAKEELSSVQ